MSRSNTSMSLKSKAKMTNESFDASVVAPANQVIGRVDTVLTRHTANGEVHFLLVSQVDGTLWYGQWSTSAPKSLPEVGTLVRVEYLSDKAISTASENAAVLTHAKFNKPCYEIAHWVLIPSIIPLNGVVQWYGAAALPSGMDRLLALIDRIETPVLQNWLIRVLRHRALGQPFFRLAASRHHHHSYPGGLLLHSVECAEWVEQIAKVSLSPKEAALAVTAALLHDLGKIETLSNTVLGRLVEHEVLSLTLMEPLLCELEQSWSHGAHALRQLLSWTNSTKKFPKFPGLLLIKMADQYSTALSARKMAFAELPDHFYWASLKTPHGKQLFNRLD